jgi:hypothetical protein
MVRRIVALGGLAILVATACGGASIDTQRNRAAFDLNCQATELVITKIDDRTQGVSGCNQRATYVETCQGQGMNRSDCTWLLNTDAKPRSSASQ